MITVSHVHNRSTTAINLKVDRTTVLGNPFYMNGEENRDKVCDMHAEWLDVQLLNKNSKEFKEMQRIYTLAKSGKNINLMCWCSPKRCHGDHIKAILDKHL